MSGNGQNVLDTQPRNPAYKHIWNSCVNTVAVGWQAATGAFRDQETLILLQNVGPSAFDPTGRHLQRTGVKVHVHAQVICKKNTVHA